MKKPDLLEDLGRDARRLRVGQSLPVEGPLTADQVRAVQDDFAFMLGQPGVSMSGVAKALGEGCSRQMLYRFRDYRPDGAPPPSIERVARALNQFLEVLARRNESKRPSGFIETVAAKRMLTVIGKTIELCAIGLIIADSGRGKSMTFEAASELWPGTVLLRVRQPSRNPTGFARLLGSALDIGGAHATAHSIQDRVIAKLSGSGRALMIDEAHQLKHDALEVVRDIHDETGCPIILAGTIGLSEAVSDPGQWHGQFASRIALRLDLTEQLMGVDGDDPRPLHSVDEIKRLYASDRVRFTDDGLVLLTRIANLPGLGGLRLCAKLAEVAAAAARGQGEPAISAERLIQVIRMLHGERYAVGSIERRADPHARGVDERQHDGQTPPPADRSARRTARSRDGGTGQLASYFSGQSG